MISCSPLCESVCCGLPPEEEEEDDFMALLELSWRGVAPPTPFFGRLPDGLIGGRLTDVILNSLDGFYPMVFFSPMFFLQIFFADVFFRFFFVFFLRRFFFTDGLKSAP